MAYVFEFGAAGALFEGDDFLCDCVFVDTSCVVECSEDVDSVLFRRCDYLVFNILMDRAEIEVRSDDGIEDLIYGTNLSTVHMNLVPENKSHDMIRMTDRTLAVPILAP